jgi:hypothetical protein
MSKKPSQNFPLSILFDVNKQQILIQTDINAAMQIRIKNSIVEPEPRSRN